ncbi:MAG: AmmeMemoRadiSam system protein A [Candidatus Moranbacteria bacterium RIFOXYB1_FULL_43_19]|nr:MAG: AmmeMemoRadiSam system protein A [Candidatus Moranbacteria bacterium RIFOXYA1_FULL_44_7]OGI27784.1 MAG: AmmeMemoRadiSam system protein A [Candidatus Moranbacteria bacterium RIFOXYB1_FULL_43_19]OGI33993.1 MAG: AmmeMemoRadiSam system protein A [Candidatus Moranbacteria bacterium RIFOXYC1_FULL_44_13]OGI37706.1 MAG: AmmeMemoRadiSam system protein A [Candidatus Moranbacteria bacterium RIFOXYD1_FULL_44_12]
MNEYAKLARRAIEKYIKHRKIIDIPDNLPPEFYEKKNGVFVSIHKGKELRGCIGTYLPVHKNLAEEIVLNAVTACSQDNRFFPVSPEELPKLSIEVSILSEPEKIANPESLDPKKYGVIVKAPDGRCGLLLPGLEAIETAWQQISIASEKAGINLATEKKLDFFRFLVKKYSEE